MCAVCILYHVVISRLVMTVERLEYDTLNDTYLVVLFFIYIVIININVIVTQPHVFSFTFSKYRTL